ncbi:hypothetical protein ACFQYP_03215 [Nonomuraea antimicrobica]
MSPKAGAAGRGAAGDGWTVWGGGVVLFRATGRLGGRVVGWSGGRMAGWSGGRAG